MSRSDIDRLVDENGRLRAELSRLGGELRRARAEVASMRRQPLSYTTPLAFDLVLTSTHMSTPPIALTTSMKP